MQNNEIKESEILKKLHVAYLRYPRTPEVVKPGKTNHTYNWLKLTSIAKYFYDHPDVSSELKTLILSGHQLYCGSYGAAVSSTDRLKRFENIKTPEYINNYIDRFLAGTLDESLATC